MKGIIVAAGSGSRLYPLSKVIPKPLFLVYDKPMIYYPLSVLIQLGVTEVLIIIPPNTLHLFVDLLGDGSNLGIRIEYAYQDQPKGIADAFIIGERFIGDESVLLVLGDNIFFNYEISNYIEKPIKMHINVNPSSAMILGFHSETPQNYGVLKFSQTLSKVVDIEEKPKNPKSNFIVPGLYYYPNDVIKKAKILVPSKRGELEITDINRLYLKESKLNVHVTLDKIQWYDAGTISSLSSASDAIKSIQYYKDKCIGYIELEAFKLGLVTKDHLLKLASEYNSEYGKNLLNHINRIY